MRAGRARQSGIRTGNGVRRRGVQRETTGPGPVHERRHYPAPRHHHHQFRPRGGHHVPIRPDQQNGVQRSGPGHTGRPEAGHDRGGDRRLAQRRHEDHGQARGRRQTVRRGRRPAGAPFRDIGPQQPVRDIRPGTGGHGRRRLQRNRTHRRRRMSDRPLYHGPALQICRNWQRKGKAEITVANG